MLAYLNYAAEKLDLLRDIRFETEVVSARYDARDRSWLVETGHGERTRARYLIAAVGPLSASQLPDIDGIDSFAGESCHAARGAAAYRERCDDVARRRYEGFEFH